MDHAGVYFGLMIRIRAWDPARAGYPVEATLSDGSHYDNGLLHVAHEALLAADLEPLSYGAELFYALCRGAVRQAFDVAAGRALALTEGRLRVRLWIDSGAAELGALAWERLAYDRAGLLLPLATSGLSPFSRYVGLQIPDPQPLAERPLRMLAAFANPDDLPGGLHPLDVTQEVWSLLEAVSDLLSQGQLALSVMPGVSGLAPELRRELERAGCRLIQGPTSLEELARWTHKHHILHLCCHGHFRREQERGAGNAALLLEGPDGAWRAVTDSDVVEALATAGPLPQLVFLASCESAGDPGSGEQPWVGMGPRLVEAGVPAVVAIRDLIGIEAARRLGAHFYASLLEHGLVDVALNQARQLLRSAADGYWSNPVLFTRLEDGRLLSPTNQELLNGRAPFMAPPLPATFVPRDEVSAALRAQLLAHGETERPLLVSAIHGLGGIGKSTLATALAHDPQIRRAFPDGVLWASLGQQPVMLAIQSSWIRALGDLSFQAPDELSASAHLRGLLAGRAALLIIDDAWKSEHVRPLLVGGEQCRTVITSRDRTVAAANKASLFDLDVMAPEQALRLFELTLGERWRPSERDDALAVADAVGYLPLALELASARVAEGIAWARYREELSSELMAQLAMPGAEELTDEESRKRLSPLASFSLSLRQLPDERRRRFALLGLLPEDTLVTATLAQTLWADEPRHPAMTPRQDAEEALRYLRNKALLLPGPPLADGSPAYRQHDLLHDMARAMIEAPLSPAGSGEIPGLATRRQAAHGALLERYRRQTGGGWHTLPDDGYIHTALTWHMEEAGAIEAIHALLREETPAGTNGWYEACDRQRYRASYLRDLARARRHSNTLMLQFRYAAIIASLNAVAQRIDPGVLVALVAREVWSAEQGFERVQQMTDPMQRALALAGLGPHLPERLHRQACLAAHGIADEELRAFAIADLAQVSLVAREELRGQEALADEGRFRVEQRQFRPQEVRDPVLDLLEFEARAAERASDTPIRALVFIMQQYQASSLLPETSSLHESWDERSWDELWLGIFTIVDLRQRMWVIRDCLPLLPEHLLAAAWEVADQVRAAMVATDEDELLQQLLRREAEDQARGQSEIELALNELMPALAVTYARRMRIKEALAAVDATPGPREQAITLAFLAERLPPRRRHEVNARLLAMLAAVEDQGLRALTISGLAARLARLGLGAELLQLVKELDSEYERVETVAVLAPHLSPAQKPRLLELVAAIVDGNARQRAANIVAPLLPAELLVDLLGIIEQIEDVDAQLLAQTALALHLGPKRRRRALQQIRQAASLIANPGRRETALGLIDALVARHEQAEEAPRWASVRRQAPEPEEASSATPAAPGEGTRLALQVALVMDNPGSQALVLAAIAPALPQALTAEVSQQLLALGDSMWTARMWDSTIARLAVLSAELGVVEGPLAAIEQIASPYWGARAVSAIAPQLSRAQLPRALVAVMRSDVAYWRAQAIDALAARSAQLRQASARDGALSGGGLERLCQLFDDDEVEQLVGVAAGIAEDAWRGRLLAALARRILQLPRPRFTTLWALLINAAITRPRRSLLEDVQALGPVLGQVLDDPELSELIQAVADTSRWWP